MEGQPERQTDGQTFLKRFEDEFKATIEDKKLKGNCRLLDVASHLYFSINETQKMKSIGQSVLQEKR